MIDQRAALSTLLLDAAHKGDVEEVERLIGMGADVKMRDARHRGWTALHAAAAWGRAEVVRLLIAAGAGVNGTTDGGWTPLHMAAFDGRAEIVRVLISACPPGILSQLLDVATNDGCTAEDLACECGHEDIVKMLRRARMRASSGALAALDAPEATL